MNSAEAETIRPTGHDYMFGEAGLCAGGTGLRAVGRASVQWGGPLCPPEDVIPEARLNRAIRDPDKDNPVSVWFLVFITVGAAF